MIVPQTTEIISPSEKQSSCGNDTDGFSVF